jgi:excisionase family DNA binding protein
MTSLTTPGQPHELSALLSPSEVSRYLGVPLGTLANWRYRGRGPASLRVGRHVRYRPQDIAAWVEEQLADNPPIAPRHAHTTLDLRGTR